MMTREGYLELQAEAQRAYVALSRTLSGEQYRLFNVYRETRDKDSAAFMALSDADRLTILEEERIRRHELLARLQAEDTARGAA